MPINKIKSSPRAKAAIAAAIIAAGVAGWQSQRDTTPDVLPPAVLLATDKLILPWEGMVLQSHWDRFAKIWDICAGITMINGKPVPPGMSFTRGQCEDMTRKQIFHDYYLPLVKAVPGYTNFPVGVQAAMLSGAYNFGVGSVASRKGMAGSTATRLHMQGKFREGCEAQTAFNKAGGIIVDGLVKRREMGDAQRIGEAEVCVSGL
ncbi:glycoside hydrolase family protein [Agrobacterium vitis]|uniref:lysozyme n=1 Tax=Agrobacterium vitis TaxID=373 RepID=UPI0008FB7F14|nr:lysozyme [Agrobacterium vitis]MUZ53014.1 glycoside hydrolase family protein [Agrobacterium vitis]MUZ91233.1 glycoside hydrolase family protein [Agrobacterium vitis]MVA40323.1 glycoside hydrolase family protein [Agrobacterium vitis]NSX96169.1 lysozyme [Agrobacterium vitis]NSZ27308.1 lysozyme [Agrobacterium vitis]